ncbi:PP2C family protein-serine/threonine phosphatase [Microbacterium sp.]|uniref:PP2C family protein-serine/threonine phosphatase n=1 Tax=Microbacterium sp. TaxID=51671 RepID=UPI002D7815F9|nr:protein phosphatase 2C domain-containing protein [Microbacterium sp.]HET6300261.1 protein phosphatase 2C domain-containing protein [Microbacterium sp.]
MPLRLSAAAVSDVGPHRATNQDSAFTAPWGAAVADGVGGGPSGDLASSAFLHRLVAGVRGPLVLDDWLQRIRIANWDLRARVEHDPSLAGMATTFTGLLTAPDDTVILAHTGDSRAYLLRDGGLTQESHDDSLVQVLVDRGLIAESDAATHPQRNIITASMQGRDADVIAIVARVSDLGDRWLLCSDGVTDYVTERALAPVLATGSPTTAARLLVELAIRSGSRDNITAVVCDVVPDVLDPLSPEFAGAAAERFREELESA